MKNRRGCRMEPFRSLPLREHRRGQGSRRKPLRGEGESPMSHNVARHSYCSTALLHLSHGIAASQWICRAPARDAGKANSYQSEDAATRVVADAYFSAARATGITAKLDNDLDGGLSARPDAHHTHATEHRFPLFFCRVCWGASIQSNRSRRASSTSQSARQLNTHPESARRRLAPHALMKSPNPIQIQEQTDKSPTRKSEGPTKVPQRY